MVWWSVGLASVSSASEGARLTPLTAKADQIAKSLRAVRPDLYITVSRILSDVHYDPIPAPADYDRLSSVSATINGENAREALTKAFAELANEKWAYDGDMRGYSNFRVEVRNGNGQVIVDIFIDEKGNRIRVDNTWYHVTPKSILTFTSELYRLINDGLRDRRLSE